MANLVVFLSSDEVTETVGELHRQVNKLQNMVQQGIADAAGAGSAGALAGRSAWERQMETLELGNDVAMWS